VRADVGRRLGEAGRGYVRKVTELVRTLTSGNWLSVLIFNGKLGELDCPFELGLVQL
jgi:hypothetical protein